MSESYLVVPIHLDALYVKDRSPVVPPAADFTRLPHSDGTRPQNADVPWLGESATSALFENNAFFLERGIHLHWRFPRALTRGRQVADGPASFPSLPDRWLVTRGRHTAGARNVEAQWVIDSRFLHPEGSASTAIAYPTWGGKSNQSQPFRRLGRVLPLQQWLSHSRDNEEFLGHPLTAVGYGEPAFAAFYPNCRSVFGFYDPQYADQIPDGLCYQVIGWYSSPQEDHLRALFHRTTRGSDETGRDVMARIMRDELGWVAEPGPPADAELLFNGSLLFRSSGNPGWQPQLKRPNITFGATITEALSAYLAHQTVPPNAEDALAVKAEIEDQLEAIMLDRVLNNLDLDLAAKFKEARHASGFDEVYSGFLWTVRADTGGNPSEENPEADIAPWPDVANLLAELNRLQHQYNRASDEIKALRHQVYSDWCRYLWRAYPRGANGRDLPTALEVCRVIEQHSLPALEEKIAYTGDLLRPPGDFTGPPHASSDSKEQSLARAIEGKLRQLLAALQAHESSSKDKTRYVVQPSVAPRYWRPTEPVILITGNVSQVDEPTHVEDIEKDGHLQCESLSLFGGAEYQLRRGPDTFVSRFSLNPRVWTRQPWHPFLLQWEVELAPFAEFGNLQAPERNYHERYITRNFTLKRTDVDLSPKQPEPLPPNPPPERDRFLYRGESLLTPHVADQFVDRLSNYLKRLQKKQWEEPGMGMPGHSIISGPDEENSLLENLLEFLQSNPPGKLGQATVDRLIEVIRQLMRDDFFCLAQRLSGFNDALLMHKQTLQIPIEDPFGSVDSRNLAERVRSAVGEHAHNTLQPHQYFSPVRSGELRLEKLRLVSTFGRHLDFQADRCITATPMRPPSSTEPTSASVFLPPRLVQPARLQFRWLAASAPHEMNSHPDSTPICGWVMANHLDQNLFIYSGDGKMQGYLQADASDRVRWYPAPGAADPVLALSRLENDYLRRVISFLVGTPEEFFKQFLTDLMNAQMRIEPEHSGTPLPIGQPLAVVRASISLELQGPPARNEGWREFRESAATPRPDCDKFTGVQFPIRLGEQDQLNDGLAVYWLEEESGSYQDNAYVIPNYDAASTDPADRRCDFLYQSVDGVPLTVTMLMDPRGVVHASSGILPIKAIRIPPHEYASALKRFEIMFLTAPVLAGKLDTVGEPAIGLPVSDPPGHYWSWLERRGNDWSAPAIQARDLLTPMAGSTEIREGWLRLAKRDDERTKQGPDRGGIEEAR